MDVLRSTYRFSCPHRGEAHVRLSSFRTIERLPGATHPVVFRVVFSCACGDEHVGLLTQAELDWEPLGLEPGLTFVNLMTSRRDDVSAELGELALAHLRAGEWPWSFFCYPEERARPVTPSHFALLAPSAGLRRGLVGVAVRCPVCDALSVNVVTQPHVDLPFWNDERVGVVEHVFASDAARTIEQFRAELHSSAFDERRLAL
ncbi:MAG TPA: hypothetical protein VFB26_03355 [Gaiellaceae bacterium]|nr:hypothetical protein [Gaiellaceae bacterium]